MLVLAVSVCVVSLCLNVVVIALQLKSSKREHVAEKASLASLLLLEELKERYIEEGLNALLRQRQNNNQSNNNQNNNNQNNNQSRKNRDQDTEALKRLLLGQK